jgi:translocation and assembly module TamA
MVEKHIELQRYRAVTDLTTTNCSLKLVLATATCGELLGTLGYFEPADVSITRKHR